MSWLTVPIIDTFIVRVDVAMPADLGTAWRQLRVRMEEKVSDLQARRRADFRSQLGVSHLSPVNGRANGAAHLAARTSHMAAVRAALAEQERLAPDDPRLYLPDAIRERVERAATVAVLQRACELAEQGGVGCLPQRRVDLQHTGYHASQAAWRREVGNGCRRLNGEFSAPCDDDRGDAGQLRRRLEDLAYSAAVEAEAE
jgi:hypothetical protein